MPARIVTRDPVITAGRARQPRYEPGGWLAAVTRARKARTVAEAMEVNGVKLKGTGSPGQERWLTFEEMWTIYRRVPDVRAAVDSIVRRISTWDWLVEPTVDVASDEYESLMDEAETVRRFLATPNTDGETWQELWTKVLTDVLVFDQGAEEMVRGRASKTLQEIVAVRGSTVVPREDEFGRLQGYEHNPSDTGLAASGKTTTFKPDELLFLRLFPTTAGPMGNSLIESIVDEVLTLLAGAKHVLQAYSVDEIPPGILVLTGIAGKAADRAKQDLSQMRGDDHKIRVITSPDPTNAGARWVELRRTMKDLELREVINDVRRIIWRVFGVLPVEMGVTEAVPRATAEVQLEVGSMHLVNPLLELIEAKVNARIVPLLLPPEKAGRIAFRFDREVKLSEEDKKTAQERLDVAVKQGLMTRNEARSEMGLPPVDGGDILTVEGNPRPLVDVITPPDEEEPEDPEDGPDDSDDPEDGDDAGDGEEDGEVTDEDAGAPSNDDDAPGEAERGGRDKAKGPMCRQDEETQQECISRVVDILKNENPSKPQSVLVAEAFDACEKSCGDARSDDDEPERKAHRSEGGDSDCSCGHGHTHSAMPSCWGNTPHLVRAGRLSPSLALLIESEATYRRTKRLPSEWQPGSIFDGTRTLDLPKLGDAIARYARTVRPIWRESKDAIIAAMAAAYDRDRGGFTDEDAVEVLQGIDDELDKLALKWKTATEPDYIVAARIARDAAADWTGDASAAEDYEDRAAAYQTAAMGYLTAADGPIAAVRRTITDAVRQGTRSGPAAPDHRAAPDDALVDSLIEEARMLAIAEAAFNGHEYRVFNWAGKLNDLSNETLVRGLEAVNRAEGTSEPVEWWAEWVYVGDARTCATCNTEGAAGLRPLSKMPLRPGGDTECRGNCRCVLVFWRQDEVQSGDAKRLGPTA